jgi:long-chain acyl-CoA synthetase
VAEKIWLKNYDPGVPKEIDIPPIPASKLLENRAEIIPDGTACTIMGMPTTYAQINERANQFAYALKEWGVKPGDRVAIIMGNSPSFIACQFGILKLGAVAVMVNPLYTGRELTHILADSGARLGVVLSLFAGNVNDIIKDTSLEKLVVVAIPGMDLPIPEGAELLDDFMDGKPTENPDCPASPDDPALVLYTGGTTGRSKGAVLTHRSQVYGAHIMNSLDPQIQSQKDSFVLVNPLFHIMGNAIMSFCIHGGYPIHLVPQYDPGLVLQTISDMKPTWFPGVPTMFIGVMNHPDVKNHDLTSIRYCVSGAAPFPVEPMEEFERITGCRVIEVFGLTESGTAVFFNPFVNERKAGSIGMPVADMDAKIVDSETGEKEMPQGQEGELILKGPPIMKEYLNMPEETESNLRDGWLYTGDIARMDEDGFFWIVDRKKDMILASGFNIYPRDVEEVLHEHPDVSLAAVIGVPDPYRGETVKAFVVPKQGTSPTEQSIIEFCRERLAAYKVPKLLEFRESLPLSIIGKVLRKELKAEEREKSK